MYRASLCAVAVIAFGAPFRDFSRRKNAPKALWLRCKLAAARRNAAAARFAVGRVRRDSTRPPLILWCGHSPSQLVKCFTVAQRLMSSPISPSTFWAVVSSIPSIRVRSTPLARCSSGRGSNPGRFRFQREQVFLAPGAVQRLCDRRLIFLAAAVTQRRQRQRVAHAVELPHSAAAICSFVALHSSWRCFASL